MTAGAPPVYRRHVRKFALILLAVSTVGAACLDADAKPKPKPKPIRVSTPGPLALDPSGALVIGDRALKRVVRYDLRTKRRTVLASGFPEAIVGVAYDDMARLYVSSGERVYRIDGKRKVVVAGTGERGHSGDGGPATAATLGGATGFDVDHDESIAIAEYDNWIRVVDPCGTQMWTSSGRHSSPRRPPPLPVRATTFMPRSCATCAAASTLAELPLVVIASSTSPSRPSAPTCLENTSL